MAVITRGWLHIDKTYPREKVVEMVQFMKRRGIQLVMIGTQVSQPEDLLRYGENIKIDARIFIDNEEDAIYFALRYV